MRRNVLITACGAKLSLTRAFRKAAHECSARLYASDVSPYAVAKTMADAVIDLPPWADPAYVDGLLEVCERHDIGLLVPTSDKEMLYLLDLREKLRAAGTMVLIPPDEAVAVCRDKLAFVRFCRQQGFPVPRTYIKEEPSLYPLFVRPAVGQGGLGSGRVETPELLAALRATNDELLIQEYVDDPEYSIDLLMDFDGRALQAVARRRLEVRGGESSVSRVECNEALTELARRVGEALQLTGHNVLQAFYSDQHGARLIEINPRFGGASSLAIEAGLDSPRRLLQLLANDAAARAPRVIRHGLLLLRHGEDYFIEATQSP